MEDQCQDMPLKEFKEEYFTRDSDKPPNDEDGSGYSREQIDYALRIGNDTWEDYASDIFVSGRNHTPTRLITEHLKDQFGKNTGDIGGYINDKGIIEDPKTKSIGKSI